MIEAIVNSKDMVPNSAFKYRVNKIERNYDPDGDQFIIFWLGDKSHIAIDMKTLESAMMLCEDAKDEK